MTAAALAAAALLSGCSMAGLASFKPLPAKGKPLAVAAAATPAAPATPATPATPAAAAKEQDGPFPALAYAEAPGPGGGTQSVNALIAKYAAYYDVPEALVHRVVKRESGYNPRAHNGPYWGLMQIRHDTARSMGYRGEPAGLLDPDTNLRYAVKYLRGAYVVGGYSQDAAMRHYARGYYYDAKRQGLLKEAGLR